VNPVEVLRQTTENVYWKGARVVRSFVKCPLALGTESRPKLYKGLYAVDQFKVYGIG
jgi:hypothetical protein